jgi:hypothetical protein
VTAGGGPVVVQPDNGHVFARVNKPPSMAKFVLSVQVTGPAMHATIGLAVPPALPSWPCDNGPTSSAPLQWKVVNDSSVTLGVSLSNTGGAEENIKALLEAVELVTLSAGPFERQSLPKSGWAYYEFAPSPPDSLFFLVWRTEVARDVVLLLDAVDPPTSETAPAVPSEGPLQPPNSPLKTSALVAQEAPAYAALYNRGTETSSVSILGGWAQRLTMSAKDGQPLEFARPPFSSWSLLSISDVPLQSLFELVIESTAPQPQLDVVVSIGPLPKLFAGSVMDKTQLALVGQMTTLSAADLLWVAVRSQDNNTSDRPLLQFHALPAPKTLSAGPFQVLCPFSAFSSFNPYPITLTSSLSSSPVKLCGRC